MVIPIPLTAFFFLSEQPVIAPKIRSSEGNGLVVYMNIPGPEKYVSVTRVLHDQDVVLMSPGRFDNSD